MCSENTRSKNSPCWLGSKVDGTIQYDPGGSLNRQVTSRRLTKVGHRAVEAFVLKNSELSGLGNRSGFSNYENKIFQVNTKLYSRHSKKSRKFSYKTN